MPRRKADAPQLGIPPEIRELIRSRGWITAAGVDEAGRGPLAGPVVAAAVILPPGARLPGVDDSKKLTPLQRSRLHDEIRSVAVAVSVWEIGPEIIDAVNILEATRRAMREAVAALSYPLDVALVDGLPVPDFPIEHVALIGGDGRCLPIAAASIVAKVTRDHLMADLHAEFPLYRFDRHKGYGTADHLARLKEFGPCRAHRMSFGPVRRWNGGGGP